MAALEDHDHPVTACQFQFDIYFIVRVLSRGMVTQTGPEQTEG